MTEAKAQEYLQVQETECSPQRKVHCPTEGKLLSFFQDAHSLTLKAWGCVALHGKKAFAAVIKARVVIGGDAAGFSKCLQGNCELLIRERQEDPRMEEAEGGGRMVVVKEVGEEEMGKERKDKREKEEEEAGMGG